MQSDQKTRAFSLIFALYVFVNTIFQTSNYAEIVKGSFFSNATQVVQAMLGMAMVLFILFARKYKVLYILGIITFVVIFTVSAFVSSYLSIVLTVLAIFTGYFMSDLDILIIYSFRARLLSTIFIILSETMNVIPSTIIDRDGVLRNSLGFYHPNTLGVTLLFLTLEYVFIHWNTWKVRNFVFPVITLLISNYVSNSRGTTVSLLMLILLLLGAQILSTHIFLRMEFFGALLLVVSLPVVSILIMIYYDPSSSFLSELDQLASLRFSFGNAIYLVYHITLLGQNIPSIVTWGDFQAINGYGIVELDNMYMSLILRNGLLYFLSFIAMNLSVTWFAFKEKRPRFIAMVIVISVLGMFEVMGTYLQFNTLFFAFGYLVRHQALKKGQPEKDTTNFVTEVNNRQFLKGEL